MLKAKGEHGRSPRLKDRSISSILAVELLLAKWDDYEGMGVITIAQSNADRLDDNSQILVELT